MPKLAALLPVLLLPLSAGAEEPSAVELLPGRPVERTLTGKEVHEYTIVLARGQSLHLVVDQRGLDVVEELRDPSGRLVIRVDTPRGGHGPEATGRSPSGAAFIGFA